MAKYSQHDYLIAPPPGHPLKWHHQIDPILLCGALIALAIGSIWCAETLRYIDPTHERSNFPRLLTFGIASAAAWACTTRAIFRVVSMEAAVFLKAGVQQRDMSPMLEMRIPNMKWLQWRRRLWRSTSYAVVCFALYVATGVMYRLAFSTKDIQRVQGGKECSYAIMGPMCGKQNLLGFYTDLMDQGVMYPTFAAPSPQYLWDELLPSSWSWQVQAAWHPQTLASDNQPRTTGWLKGWHLVGITIRDGDDLTKPNFWLQGNDSLSVATHPKCGPMLKGKTANTTNGGESVEYWFGLAISDMKTTYARISRNINDPDFKTPTANFSIASGEISLSAEGCPLSLERAAYESMLDLVQDDVLNPAMWMDFAFMLSNGNGGIEYTWSDLARKRTIFALLLAILQVHPEYISKSAKASLIDKDLLRETAAKDSCECLYSPGFQFEKRTSVTIYAFPKSQFAASTLIMVWGVMLLVAAWPYRRFVVRGTLDQYMALGADIGSKGMLGASTGKFSAESETLWRLVETTQEQGARKIELEEVPSKLSSGSTVRVKLGCRYV
ncbi:hypothetical protein P154DRAFT_614514 [Amniculicola lignicola CBS 123094]|uniref:Uncharacterized protein n=1 Tax=Amniculicola lignicola CBS 123094 TaxID=1392246 RepID=A0A6A5X5Q3_9PLEO|nr:hypothetical protein P154DRAFT_614514 [Amniculicola lignicola CBS 123094]